MNIFKPILMIIFLCCSHEAVSQRYHPWEVFSISLRSSSGGPNPYSKIPYGEGEDIFTVTFSGVSGEAMGRIVDITGYWNGGDQYKANFAPPVAGRWRYVTKSSDRRLNNHKGEIEVIPWSAEERKSNPVRNGLVRVRKSPEGAGHFFEYSDGTPFLWIGDTWWNWTHRNIKTETFMSLVDDRAAKGFNVGQLFVPGNGWSRQSSLLDETYTILDTAHANKVERMVRYANSKGMTVWIHGWWSREGMAENIGPEKMRRWWKYLVHRFSAYNVIWVLAGEYNMYNNGGFPLDFWNELGRMIKDEDPYERIISVHNTPPFWGGGAEAPQWGTGSVLHDQEWLDYNQTQVGHGRYANEMIPLVIEEEYSRKPAKPVVVTEPWYEFIEGNPTGLDIRFAAWSAILSGAAGHTYGGGHVWLASVPEAPSGGGTWPYEKGFDRTTYDYEGAVSMKHLASFFRQVEWWNMTPRPDIVSEYPQPLCLAFPGREYILYLRYGGVAKIKMDKSAASGTYIYRWFNPGTGEFHPEVEAKGEDIMSFSCPESYPAVTDFRDWVLHIRKKE